MIQEKSEGIESVTIALNAKGNGQLELRAEMLSKKTLVKFWFTAFLYFIMSNAGEAYARPYLPGGQKAAQAVLKQSVRFKHYKIVGGHYNNYDPDGVRDFYFIKKGNLFGNGKSYCISIYTVAIADSFYWRIELYRTYGRKYQKLQTLNIEDGHLSPQAGEDFFTFRRIGNGREKALFVLENAEFLSGAAIYSVYRLRHNQLKKVRGFSDDFPNPEYKDGRWISAYSHACCYMIQQAKISGFRLHTELSYFIDGCHNQPKDASLIAISLNKKKLIYKRNNIRTKIPHRLYPYFENF